MVHIYAMQLLYITWLELLQEMKCRKAHVIKKSKNAFKCRKVKVYMLFQINVLHIVKIPNESEVIYLCTTDFGIKFLIT